MSVRESMGWIFNTLASHLNDDAGVTFITFSSPSSPSSPSCCHDFPLSSSSSLPSLYLYHLNCQYFSCLSHLFLGKTLLEQSLHFLYDLYQSMEMMDMMDMIDHLSTPKFDEDDLLA
jgi:hypothetical protein